MNHPTPNALAITRPLLVFLQWLNGLYALAIAGLLVFCLVNPGFVFRAMKIPPGPGSNELVACLLAVVVIGIAAAALVHVVLRHLRAMVDTVRAGDPFVAANARRLRAIAWLVMAGEVLRLAIAAVVRIATPYGKALGIDIDIAVQFSLAPWLAVALLFVLAGVFAHGTRMRDDLEGTV
jgi:hypothetical protein